MLHADRNIQIDVFNTLLENACLASIQVTQRDKSHTSKDIMTLNDEDDFAY